MLKFGTSDGNSDDDSFKPGRWFSGFFGKEEEEEEKALLQNNKDTDTNDNKKESTENEGSSWLTGFKGMFKKEENPDPVKDAHEELYKIDDDSSASGSSWFSGITDKFSFKPKDDQTANETTTTPTGQQTKTDTATKSDEQQSQDEQPNAAVSWLLGSKKTNDENRNDSPNKAASSAGLDLSLYKTTDTTTDDQDEENSSKTESGWFSNIKGLVVKDTSKKEPEEDSKKTTETQTGITKYIYSLKLQVRAISTYFRRIVSFTTSTSK